MLILLVPRTAAAADEAVQVETSLSVGLGSIELRVHNPGQVTLGVVGIVPCDPGIRATLTTPDGRQAVLTGRTPTPLGSCEIQVLQEHEIPPGGSFYVNYRIPPEFTSQVGTYTVAFTTPLASYAKRAALQITEPFSFTIPFTDVALHWAWEQVADAVARGWVSGYPDGTFRPDQPVTYGEFSKMLVLAKGLPPAPGPADVDWSSPWRNAAIQAGWMQPGLTGEVRQFDAIAMVVRASGLAGSSEIHGHREAWEFAERNRIILATVEFKHSTNSIMTRAIAVALIWRMQGVVEAANQHG